MMRRAGFAVGLVALLGSCGGKAPAGFDWAAGQSAKTGKVHATLRRFAILPRTDENLDKEPSGVTVVVLKPGKGHYFAGEFGILVDGKPIWDLAAGGVTGIGPVEVSYPKKTLTNIGPVNADKVPAPVRENTGKRDAFYVLGPCSDPMLGEKPQPFEVRLTVTLKSGGKTVVRFSNLVPPRENP
jgi:hypothetical protein